MLTRQITIKGETREIEMCDFRGDGASFSSVRPVGLFRKHGGKLWAEKITLWRQKDGSYRLGQTTTILNRSGYSLVGWADGKENSRHNSAINSVIKSPNASPVPTSVSGQREPIRGKGRALTP